VGKTTVIKEVARELRDQAGGFYTEEVRDDTGRRTGFRLVTLDGREAVMAHVDLRDQERPQVSRYGVDVSAIDSVGVAALRQAMASDQVVIIDEIGKMELFSNAFKEAVQDALESELHVLGTVMRGSRPWVDELKAKQQVDVWEVTVENRDRIAERILRRICVDANANQRYNKNHQGDGMSSTLTPSR
jgi:nucleoside-triphosphatase